MPKREEDPKKRNIQQEEESVVFEATPSAMDVEKEAEETAKKSTKGGGPDMVVLADALVKMGEKMLGVELYSYQRGPAYRIIYSLLSGDGAEITMLFSRQSGKSEVVSFAVNVLAIFLPFLGKQFKELSHFSNGVKIGLFAPQLDQVETVYGRCVDRLLADSTQVFLSDPDIADRPLSQVNYKLKSGSFVKAQSGAKQSKIESKTYNIVFIDESQDMDTTKVRKSILPMTASTYGTIVRLGTPNGQKGDFFETIKRNKAHDKRLSKKERETLQLHYEYDYKAVIAAKRVQYERDGKPWHLMYEKSVNRDLKSMGANSDEFRMSYKLDWLFDIGMFITEEELETHLYDRRMVFPDVERGDFIVAGLDIASARASTVLTYGKVDKPAKDLFAYPEKLLMGWYELDGDYERQYSILERLLIDMKVKVLFADYTGVGRGLTDRLIHNLGDFIHIQPYTFTPVSKSDMWKSLDEDIKNNRIKIPAHENVYIKPEFKAFEEQFLHLQKYWKGKFMVCEKTTGYKDDYPDSFGLFNLAGNFLYQPNVMEESDNMFFGHDLGSRRRSRTSSW